MYRITLHKLNFIKTFLALLVCLFLASAVPPNCEAWWDVDWQCRKVITIDSAQVDADLTNFVVYINLATDVQLAAKAQADGDDITFIDNDDLTQLNHELTTYTAGTGQLECYVKIPTVSSSSHTSFYMYYGNATALAQENVIGTWQNTGYHDVYHCEEDPNGDGLLMLNSVTNTLEGTVSGSMTSADLRAAQMGNGLDFDGTDDGVQFYTPDPGFFHNDWSDRSMEGWVSSVGTGSGPKIQTDWGNSTHGWAWLYRTAPDDYCISTESGGAKAEAQGVTPDAEDGTLYYIAGIADADNSNGNFTASNNFGIWINGVMEDEDVQSFPITGDTENPCAGFGKAYGTNSHTNCVPHLGILDEIRISEVSRSSAFIDANYNNQKTGSTFYSLGSEECLTITATQTQTQTQTVTATLTVTATPTQTQTITNTPTQTLTATNTQTLTATPTLTATATNTQTISATPTLTPTFTATQTVTNTPTLTLTSTATQTPTLTNTPTLTITITPSETPICYYYERYTVYYDECPNYSVTYADCENYQVTYTDCERYTVFYYYGQN